MNKTTEGLMLKKWLSSWLSGATHQPQTEDSYMVTKFGDGNMGN